MNTKLDPALGDAVAAYEYMRHAAAIPGYPDWKKLEQEGEVAALALAFMPNIREILLADGFPEVPFYRLSSQTQGAIRSWFDYCKDWAVRCPDIRFLHKLGVFHSLSKQLSAIPDTAPYTPAVVKLSPDLSVVCLVVSHNQGSAAVQRGLDHWLRTHAHQFLKGGRRMAGLRTKEYPWSKVKDLAGARLLALGDFRFAKVNDWTERNQPRDRDAKHFPWSGKKDKNSTGPLFETPRDARRLLARFERTRDTFTGLAMQVIANLEISAFVKGVITKAENPAVFGLQKSAPSVH